MRTECGTPLQNINKFWHARLVTRVGIPGSEHVVSNLLSLPLFPTSDAAYAASDTELDFIERYGRVHNDIWKEV